MWTAEIYQWSTLADRAEPDARRTEPMDGLPMDAMMTSLRATAATQWRDRLIGRATAERNHWVTKTTYYRAVERTLESGIREPSWADVVGSVSPRGSRTTFYDLAGRKARHPLVRAYQERAERGLLLLSFRYQRSNAVEQLVDETKVWSFWPYRGRWLTEVAAGSEATVRHAGDRLVRALAEWSRRNPALAGAVRDEPPICAVEDLMLLHRWEIPLDTAVGLCRDAMTHDLVGLDRNS